MNTTRRLFVLGLLALALFAAACQQQPVALPDTRAAEAATIRAAAQAWSKAADLKDLEKCLSFYADDASFLPPNAPIATGREQIRQVWASLMAAPGFSLTFAPTKIEVARSGDIAYDLGTYELTMNDPTGKPVTTKGKYVVVWKKQGDKTWKAAADIFNADQ